MEEAFNFHWMKTKIKHCLKDTGSTVNKMVKSEYLVLIVVIWARSKTVNYLVMEFKLILYGMTLIVKAIYLIFFL